MTARIADVNTSLDTDKVDRAGDTMTGPLVVPAPTAGGEATNKTYVDSQNTAQNSTIALKADKTYVDTQDALKVSKAGDTMGGPLNVVTPPTAPANAASKAYVDAQVGAVAQFPEAPLDGLTYGRKNGGWATVVGGAFTDDAPPPPPLVDGQLWWDSARGILYVYYQDVDGFQWVQTNGGGSGGAVVFTDDLAPANPIDGQMWWRSSLGQLMVYYDDGNTKQWVQASVATFPTDYARKTASRKNMVVNGALNVSQENGNTEGTTPGYYAADQMTMEPGGSGSVGRLQPGSRGPT